MDENQKQKLIETLIESNASNDFFTNLFQFDFYQNLDEIENTIIDLHNCNKVNLFESILHLSSENNENCGLISLLNTCIKSCKCNLDKLLLAVDHLTKIEDWYGAFDAFEVSFKNQNFSDSPIRIFEQTKIENLQLFSSCAYLQFDNEGEEFFEQMRSYFLDNELHCALSIYHGMCRFEYENNKYIQKIIDLVFERLINLNSQIEFINVIRNSFLLLETNPSSRTEIIELIFKLYDSIKITESRFELERLIYINKERLSIDEIIRLLIQVSTLKVDLVPQFSCMGNLLNQIWLNNQKEDALKIYENSYSSINREYHENYFSAWYGALANEADGEVIGNLIVKLLLTKNSLHCELVKKIINRRKLDNQTSIQNEHGVTELVHTSLENLSCSLNIDDHDSLYLLEKVLGWLFFNPDELVQLSYSVINNIQNNEFRSEAIKLFSEIVIVNYPYKSLEYIQEFIAKNDLDWLSDLRSYAEHYINGIDKGRKLCELKLSSEQIQTLRKRQLLETREFQKGVEDGSQLLQLFGKSTKLLYGSGSVYQQTQGDGTKKRIEMKHVKTSLQLTKPLMLNYDPQGLNIYIMNLCYGGLINEINP